ncbi:MAG: aromatic ring-hydroxylating dioxygenase subunit alpha [Bacteroidia bacterium]|nr:aromatic ring-hydroxylating dioxygenase subunit alpha [Bacteroidia bacterium]MDW8347905.1 aromatic ring-hydroxylating dioxygenase subunit alpha [Bacteroidia bacterium]
MKYFVDADITQACTLDTHFYRSTEEFERSKEKIFARTWQFVDDTDNISTAEQVLPFTLLEGFLDEPLLFTRDSQDTLHCLANVCTHRGNRLVEGCGSLRQLRCKYHGRRFDLTGRMLSMPEFEGVKNFPSEQDNLMKLNFYVWAKLLFVSINPAAPIEHFLGEMQKRLSWLPLNNFYLEPSRKREYLVKAHWALYCENYLEGFHIPYVHSTLSEVLDYGSYTTEIYEYSNLQLGIAKDGEECFDLPPDSVDYGKKIAAYYYWVFPNLMFNFYPWGLSINVVKPITPTLTKVVFLPYVYDAPKLSQGAGSDLDRVEREDEAVVVQVQKGVVSRLYKGGRYSPRREQGTHHFHRLIARFMNE